MKGYIIGVTVVLMLSHVESAHVRDDPLVFLDQGLVRGQRASDGDYTTFLGIPYASVDANNPFGPAQPPEPFEGEIYRANNGSIICPQIPGSRGISEDATETLDCLRVNIYVPNNATSDNPLPVLVWIHGGRFSIGNAPAYRAEALVKQNIIVVTVNYRLGPYGFMCLDVPNVPGNQGLKDQYDALRWVRNNIGAFGGNPYNVTLAGQSAGSCSVLLQLYSQKEKLFHKVIAQSGTPQKSGMFVNADTQAAVKLANYLGFNTADTSEALEFLATVPHNLVTAATAALDLTLRPCKERSFSGVENFVDSDPFQLSNPKKVSSTPIMIGHTSKEEIRLPSTTGYFDSDPFYVRMANNFNLEGDRLSWVASTMRHYYIGDKAVNEQVASRMGDFESDFYFNHPIKRTLSNLLAEGAGPVYSYMFSHVGDSGEDGAGHSAELKYLFNMNGNTVLTEEQQKVSEHMTTLWANFVKYGNPTPRYRNPPVTWTPVTAEARPYLVIDQTLRMESRVYNERMAFWDMFQDNYGSLNKLASSSSA